jgi:hypothetical protein
MATKAAPGTKQRLSMQTPESGSLGFDGGTSQRPAVIVAKDAGLQNGKVIELGTDMRSLDD